MGILLSQEDRFFLKFVFAKIFFHSRCDFEDQHLEIGVLLPSSKFLSVRAAVACAIFCHSSEVCRNRSPVKGVGDGGSERPAGASPATDADSAPEARTSPADGALDKVFQGFPYWHCRREEKQRIDNRRVAEQRNDKIRAEAFHGSLDS